MKIQEYTLQFLEDIFDFIMKFLLYITVTRNRLIYKKKQKKNRKSNPRPRKGFLHFSHSFHIETVPSDCVIYNQFQQNSAKLFIKLHEIFTGLQQLRMALTNPHKTKKKHTFPHYNSEFHTFHDLEKQKVEFHTIPGNPYSVRTLQYSNFFIFYLT